MSYVEESRETERRVRGNFNYGDTEISIGRATARPSDFDWSPTLQELRTNPWVTCLTVYLNCLSTSQVETLLSVLETNPSLRRLELFCSSSFWVIQDCSTSTAPSSSSSDDESSEDTALRMMSFLRGISNIFSSSPENDGARSCKIEHFGFTFGHDSEASTAPLSPMSMQYPNDNCKINIALSDMDERMIVLAHFIDTMTVGSIRLAIDELNCLEFSGQESSLLSSMTMTKIPLRSLGVLLPIVLQTISACGSIKNLTTASCFSHNESVVKLFQNAILSVCNDRKSNASINSYSVIAALETLNLTLSTPESVPAHATLLTVCLPHMTSLTKMRILFRVPWETPPRAGSVDGLTGNPIHATASGTVGIFCKALSESLAHRTTKLQELYLSFTDDALRHIQPLTTTSRINISSGSIAPMDAKAVPYCFSYYPQSLKCLQGALQKTKQLDLWMEPSTQNNRLVAVEHDSSQESCAFVPRNHHGNTCKNLDDDLENAIGDEHEKEYTQAVSAIFQTIFAHSGLEQLTFGMNLCIHQVGLFQGLGRAVSSMKNLRVFSVYQTRAPFFNAWNDYTSDQVTHEDIAALWEGVQANPSIHRFYINGKLVHGILSGDYNEMNHLRGTLDYTTLGSMDNTPATTSQNQDAEPASSSLSRSQYSANLEIQKNT